MTYTTTSKRKVQPFCKEKLSCWLRADASCIIHHQLVDCFKNHKFCTGLAAGLFRTTIVGRLIYYGCLIVTRFTTTESL
jgi:hypothetical protein